jgi:hypothetical protein
MKLGKWVKVQYILCRIFSTDFVVECFLHCFVSVTINEHLGVLGQGKKCNLITLLIFIDVVNAICIFIDVVKLSLNYFK